MVNNKNCFASRIFRCLVEFSSFFQNIPIFAHRYQKKIGTYDKQEWETGVEERILRSFNDVPLRKTKLKTDLIDVDLIRGGVFIISAVCVQK